MAAAASAVAAAADRLAATTAGYFCWRGSQVWSMLLCSGVPQCGKLDSAVDVTPDCASTRAARAATARCTPVPRRDAVDGRGATAATWTVSRGTSGTGLLTA